MKVIKARSQVGFWLLLPVWLLVVILPTLLFCSAFDRFLSFSHEQQKQRVKPLLFAEMQQFKEDLAFDRMLQEDFQTFDRKQGFYDINSDAVAASAGCDASRIRSDLERHLGFPVFMVMAHGADTLQTDCSMAAASFVEVKMPSTTMLRRFFALVNDQMAHSQLFPENYRPAFPPGVAYEDEKVRKVYLEGFLQNLLGTSMPFNVQPRRLYGAVASKIGDTGRVYIYYGAGSMARRQERCISTGYLAVIRAADIAESHIVRKASSRSFYPDLLRRMTFLQPAVADPDNFSWHGYSQIREQNGNYSLTTIVPPRQLVRIVQKGGIVARDSSAFAGKTVGIEVFCRLSQLQHPLWHYRQPIYLLLRLLVLAGALIFMRLYLFGFDMQMSLSIKISLAVVAAGFLPLLSLLLSMAAYDDSARAARHDRIQRFIKIRNREIQDYLAADLRKREEQAQELAENMGSIHERSPLELHEYLQAWMKKRPVDAILYKPLLGETMPVIPTEAALPTKVAKNADAAKVFCGSIAEMLLSSPLLNPDRQSMSTLLTEGSGNIGSTHTMMISNGRIINLAKLQGRSRIAVVLACLPGKIHTPVAVIMIIYSLDRLIEEMLQGIAARFSAEEELAGWHIDRAFGVEADGQIYKSLFASSSQLDDDFVMNQMRACFSSKRDIQWSGRKGGEEMFSFVCFDQSLPLLNLTVIRVPAAAGVMAGIEFWRWLYPFLLILFILLFSRYFFIGPALQLARGLSLIAGGDLQHRLQLHSGDEFETLAQEFNQMAQGLMEKEQLEAYVSSDVLAEARVSEVAHLHPGGERIGASVVFVSLLPLDKETAGDCVQLSHINSFLDLAQILCADNHGVIDKVIGHTLMLVFRTSENNANHQLNACHMVMQLVAAVQASQLGSSCRVAAGLACGQLVSGKIGSRNGRLDFTVIGDTVNLAARLKSYAENLTDSPILISEELRAAVAERIATRLESEVQLKGKSLQTRVYRIV